MQENLQRRTTAATTTTEQQSTSLEEGVPSVGSIVMKWLFFNKEIKKNESNHKIHRFGQQDVHVLNKLLISMQISIIFDRISMLNQKKLSIGICVYSRRSFNYWNLLSVYFIHSFLDGHCLTKESNRNYTVHRWSFLL